MKNLPYKRLRQLQKTCSKKPYSPSQVNQYLAHLGDSGFIFKNRYGKYSFAVPLLSEFIKRQIFEGVEFPPRRPD